MTTANATAKEAPKKLVTDVTKVIVPTAQRMFLFQNGPVMLVNDDLVPAALSDLVLYMLKDPKGTFVPTVQDVRQGHGVHMVDFRLDGTPYEIDEDGTKQLVNCMYYHEPRAVVVNVRACVIDAFDSALGEGCSEHAKYQNLKHVVWQNLVGGVLHEMHHAQSFIDDDADLLRTNKDAQDKEEDEANEFSRLSLFELAKQVNIEPMLNEHIEKIIETVWERLGVDDSEDENVVEFRKCQEYMDQTGDAWVSFAKDTDSSHHIIKTYRAFMHFVSGAGEDDPEWTAEVPYANTFIVNEEYRHTMLVQQGEAAVVETQPAYEPVEPQFQQQPTADMGYAPPVEDIGVSYEAPQTQEYQPQHQPVQPAQYTQPVAQDPAVNNNVVVGANTYQPVNMAIQDFQRVVNGLYAKIFTHVFDVCHFNPSNGPQVPFFLNRGKIKDVIALTPEENLIVKEMDCYNAGGQLMLNQPAENFITGRFLDKEEQLPGFVLGLTTPDGTRIIRKFLPQNPWNTDQNGQYKKTALSAQAGVQIMWVLDPFAVNKSLTTRIYKDPTKGGQCQLQSNVSGKWQAA